jgi:hypothetical protein
MVLIFCVGRAYIMLVDPAIRVESPDIRTVGGWTDTMDMGQGTNDI